MSTERKPGSRGTTVTFSGNPANQKSDLPFDHEKHAEQVERSKGSTRDSGVRKGFKKKPRK